MFRALISCVAVSMCLTLPALAQGPVVLMGIDAEDGNVSNGNHGGLGPYTDVLNLGVLPSVANGGTGLLVVGGGKSPADDVTLFWDAIAANLGVPVTYVNGAANIASQSFAGFAILGIASSQPETFSGGLTDAENNALSLRAPDVADHVNGGGGLFGTSQTGLSDPYGYLGVVGAFTFNFPALFDDVEATTDGEALGITDTNMDVCCWHDEYVTFPGFLNVLAVNNDTGTNPCALGGFDVIIVKGITLTPLSAVNPINTEHTVTATVADNMGNPIEGAVVTFEVTSGPHAGTTDADVTNASGQAFFTYLGTMIGLDTIQGCFTDSMGVELCDVVTKEWVMPACFTLDFQSEDDFSTPLVNGQHIDTEFGAIVSFASSGPNAGIAVFDSTVNGPNDPSGDPDLLVDTGNILILQTENFPPDGNDIFPVPDDDRDGGTLTLFFNALVEPMSVRLIDLDGTDGSSSVVLTDDQGLQRTYTLPTNWTGDLTQAEPGEGTLDLTTLAPQPGHGSIATAVEDAGFDASAVVQMDFNHGGSAGIDDLSCCLSGAIGDPMCWTERYCSTGVNSSGAAAEIGWSGSLSLAVDTFALEATNCPPGQFGLFFYGSEQIAVPFGDGVRCVGAGASQIFRLPVVAIDAAGTASHLPDWSNPPSAPGLVVGGSTWNYQFWFRDSMGPGGHGFNTSDAISIRFCD